MRTKLVAANWKMNGSMDEVLSFVSAMQATDASAVDVLLCPPALFIPAAADAVTQHGIAMTIGAQDVGIAAQGAHTGEIGAEMLRLAGAYWTLVGHSERRLDQEETDDLIATKMAAAVRGELRPILCVGETLEQRQTGSERVVVARQLEAVLDRLDPAQLLTGAIAYEPVWAIGTGETATPAQAQEMHGFIREMIDGVDPEAARAMRIVYGGSVKPDNATALFAEADIDGALVGGASMRAESFAAIIAAAAAA
ncbi:MAG: triose-phosphate isomerase [Pseudomonadota bacterium]